MKKIKPALVVVIILISLIVTLTLTCFFVTSNTGKVYISGYSHSFDPIHLHMNTNKDVNSNLSEVLSQVISNEKRINRKNISVPNLYGHTSHYINIICPIDLISEYSTEDFSISDGLILKIGYNAYFIPQNSENYLLLENAVSAISQ